MKKKIFWTIILTLLFGSLLTYFVYTAHEQLEFYNTYSQFASFSEIKDAYLAVCILFSCISIFLFANYIVLILSIYKKYNSSKILTLLFSMIEIDLYIFSFFISQILVENSFSCLFVALPLLILCVSIVFAYFIHKEWQRIKTEKNKSIIEKLPISQENE